MQRIIWVDIIKCIAIWLMVLGHANLNNNVCNILINAFHMPIFFFASGLFIKQNKLKIHLAKDSKALLQPYFICSLLALSICWISPMLHPELYPGINTFFDIFKHAIIGIFIMEDKVTNYSFLPYGPLWFLPSLFIARLFFQLVIRICTNKSSLILMLSGLISIVLYYNTRNYNFLSIDSAFMCYPFLLLGYFFNKISLQDLLNKVKYILVFPLGIIFYLLSIKNGLVNVDGGIYGNHLILFYINALLGILFLICFIFCCNSKKVTTISFLGQNSLIVLITHVYILIPIKILLKLAHLNLANLHLSISILISLLVMFISYYLSNIILKYIPFIIGKTKLKQ